MPLTRVLDLIERVGSYPWWEVLVEFALIWVVVYAVVRFVQGTRAAGALKGLLALIVIGTIIVRILGGEGAFERIGYLYDRALALIAIALVVVFQPELRRALIRLGETNWFRGTKTDIEQVAGDIATACVYLSKSRFGALIVVERSVGLRSLIEGGTELNADLSARLLQTIFYPGSALHDLAVVVRGRKAWAAGVQLPMADPSDMPDPSLGSRHRAAVGISKESDALVIVVSEETGLIRLAERGVLGAAIPADALERVLTELLGADTARADDDEGEMEVFDASEPGTMIETHTGTRGASQVTTITDRPKEAG